MLTAAAVRTRQLCLLAGLCAATLLTACSTVSAPGAVPDGSAPPATTAPEVKAAPLPQAALPPAVSEPVKEKAETGNKPQAEPGDFVEVERGRASWYGKRFQGKKTASGEIFDMHELTAAHRSLPFGTIARVRSLVNGKEVDVRINDRGPYARGRVIDLSRAAAQELGMLGRGVKNVVISVPAAAAEQNESKAGNSVSRPAQ